MTNQQNRGLPNDARLPDVYPNRYEDRGTDTLLVTFSPHSKFAFQKQLPQYSKLFLRDPPSHYYLPFAGEAATTIARFAREKGYRRIATIGSSKAGFGALLWARLMAAEGIETFAYAFSPQLRLWPYDRTLPYPSYRKIFREKPMPPELEHALRAHGDISRLGPHPGFHGEIVYSEGYPPDVAQAMLGRAVGLDLHPVSLPFHGAIFLFDTSLDGLTKKVERTYASADEDTRASLPANPADLKAMLAGMAGSLSFDALLAKHFTIGPRTSPERPTAVRRLVETVRRLLPTRG